MSILGPWSDLVLEKVCNECGGEFACHHGPYGDKCEVHCPFIETEIWVKQDEPQIYQTVPDLIAKIFPALWENEIAVPQDCVDKDCWIEPDMDVFTLIVHLNDHHQWSREAVADWLEALDLDLTFPVGP